MQLSMKCREHDAEIAVLARGHAQQGDPFIAYVANTTLNNDAPHVYCTGNDEGHEIDGTSCADKWYVQVSEA